MKASKILKEELEFGWFVNLPENEEFKKAVTEIYQNKFSPLDWTGVFDTETFVLLLTLHRIIALEDC